MAPKSSSEYAPFGPSVPLVIFGPQFALPYEVELVVKEKSFDDDMTIRDVRGTEFFHLKAKTFSLHGKRALYDINMVPIFNIREKAFSLHSITYMYAGLEQNFSELICTMSEVLKMKPMAHVFLKGNLSKDNPDFIITGGFWAREFQIRDSHGAVIARASREPTLAEIFAGADTYFVRIPPNVDTAFIVGLMSYIDEVFVDPYQQPGGDSS